MPGPALRKWLPGPGLRKWLLGPGLRKRLLGSGLLDPGLCGEIGTANPAFAVPNPLAKTQSVRQIAVSRTEPRLAVAVEFREGKH